jgi:hypothetical protein
MITRSRRLFSGVHLPLRHVAMCLDCEDCFEIGPDTCPACGSTTWTALSRFLEQASASRLPRRRDGSSAAAKGRDEPRPMPRQLVIVARSRAKLYEYLRLAFVGNETIRVLFNQRVVERRQRHGRHEPDRRQGDRRSPLRTEGLLRETGWAVVRQNVAAPHRGPAR